MGNLRCIDLSVWALRAASLPTPLALVQWICTCDPETWSGIQCHIQQRLKQDDNVKALGKARPKASQIPHFGRYRKNKWYDQYHEAARAVAANNATPEQKGMADGLKAEIEASPVNLPTGQILFHGRAERSIEQSPCPTVISTSLDATVARSHSWKRHCANPTLAPTIYVLTLAESLPAIWGQYGNVFEYELVLPPGLTVSSTAIHNAGNYLVVEATVSR